MQSPPEDPWSGIKKFLLFLIVTLVALSLIIGIIRLILFGYYFEGTGFGASTIPTYPDREIQPPKKLWDWLGLLVIPTILALGATLYTWLDRRSERTIANQRIEEERKIAEDRAQDAALQSYFEQMSIFLIDKELRNSKEGSEERALARAWTLTFLRRLNDERKGILLRFLYESELITKDNLIISLSEADLGRANLIEANLLGATLSKANLSGANLFRATLRETNLSKANLSGAKLFLANLIEANLMGANLSGASLVGANLSGAYLIEANLIEAKLSEAILIEANLSEAILSGANLDRAKMSRANLDGANLNGADLSGADLNGIILKNAKYDKVTTKWPAGFDPASHGAILIEEI